MGLLYEAIREHLELKRRAGADPGEIARTENEALSPVVPEPGSPPEEPAPLREVGEDHAAGDPAAAPVADDLGEVGEETAELDEAGKIVSTEGSWETGVDGARPGIFMPADPAVGYSGAQEFYPGQAEDHFVVLLIDQTLKVPAGSYSGVLVTAEWTPLEPSVLSEKAYAKGIGEIREADVAGGDEKLELVKVAGL